MSRRVEMHLWAAVFFASAAGFLTCWWWSGPAFAGVFLGFLVAMTVSSLRVRKLERDLDAAVARHPVNRPYRKARGSRVLSRDGQALKRRVNWAYTYTTFDEIVAANQGWAEETAGFYPQMSR